MRMCSVILISQCPYTNLFPNVGRIQAWQMRNNLLQQQTNLFNPANEFHKLPLCVPDVQWIKLNIDIRLELPSIWPKQPSIVWPQQAWPKQPAWPLPKQQPPPFLYHWSTSTLFFAHFFKCPLQGSLLKSNCLLVKILAAAKACQLVATAEASFELCQHQVWQNSSQQSSSSTLGRTKTGRRHHVEGGCTFKPKMAATWVTWTCEMQMQRKLVWPN